MIIEILYDELNPTTHETTAKQLIIDIDREVFKVKVRI